jgi:imidazolonepropionase
LLTLRGPAGPRRGAALSALGIIPDGAILVQDGVIDEAGPARRVENLQKARDAVEISAAGRVVMPGFVDSHTHLLYPPRGDRFAEPETAARLWAAATTRLLASRARRFLDAMARHGATTIEVKTGCGPSEKAILKALRVAALLNDGPAAIVPTHLLRIPDILTDVEAEELAGPSTRRILGSGRAAFAELWWDGVAPRRAAYARFIAEAARCGVGLKIHASGPSCGEAVALAVGHRAASIDHLEHLTADLASLLAHAPTVATLIPAAALDEWAPVAPARALIDAGAAVALATNFNAHHAPGLSMQTAVALACLRMEMTPEEAIAAATINGACALGRGHIAGSLEPGKSADLLLLNADDYHELARAVGVNLVHLTMKSGVVVYREGAVTTVRA